MTDVSTPVTWSRATWEAAGRATGYRLAWLCPLCPDENGMRIDVDGGQGFNVPLNWNAASFTIGVPVEGDESTVVWKPCGHRIVVGARLDVPWDRTDVL